MATPACSPGTFSGEPEVQASELAGFFCLTLLRRVQARNLAGFWRGGSLTLGITHVGFCNCSYKLARVLRPSALPTLAHAVMAKDSRARPPGRGAPPARTRGGVEPLPTESPRLQLHRAVPQALLSP